MEVVPLRLPGNTSPTTTVGIPFNKRNVEEWSRLDRLTGVMEKAKIETDHWAARTNNAAHNYGKVIDSRERNSSDGSLQERQRKQMEVFQTKVPGGSMQVIRTQTITTSSKKWTSSCSDKIFGDLELPVNSLDLSSQKTKGSVGRSGSIGGRRPPTRPRSLISQTSNTDVFGEESSAFGLYHQLHQEAKTNKFNEFSHLTKHNESFKNSKHSDNESCGLTITDVTNHCQNEDFAKINLTRQKSCSNENLAIEAGNENLLRRSSKVRRSLPFSKQCRTNSESDTLEESDASPTKSLRERAAEIEKLLREGSSITTHIPHASDKSSEFIGKVKFLKTKESFISAETLKEVRNRLKKPNVVHNDIHDDGIDTEKDESSLSRKVRISPTFTESLPGNNKKPNINGTGSLESRYSNKGTANESRTSEWYKRRKSYGFEHVEEYDKFDKFNKKNQMDSSTDSGICQSSESMGTLTWNKNTHSTWAKISPETPKKIPAAAPTAVTVRVQKNPTENFVSPVMSNHSYDKVNSVYLDDSSNVCAALRDDLKKEENKGRMFKYSNYKDESQACESVLKGKSPILYNKTSDPKGNIKSTVGSTKNPWISQLRGTKLVDRNWGSDEQEDLEENKYNSDGSDKHANHPNSREDFGKTDVETSGQRKAKRVEFCKTEVHFAAESGKFNIVETEGKPPPNDLFRRRRRNTGSYHPKNANGMPETKFGDSSYEKPVLRASENAESITEKIEAELQELSRMVVEALPQPKKESDSFYERKNPSWLYDVAEEPIENGYADNAKPRSILKNYRNSFLLGEKEFHQLKADCSETPVHTSTPVWRSTVILRNKRFDDVKKRNDDDKKLYSSDGETELQMRLRNLRKTERSQRKPVECFSQDSVNSVQSGPKRRSLPDEIMFKNSSYNSFGDRVQPGNDETPFLSVAERVKQVEELKSNNYSTKINFRSGEMTVVQNGTSNTGKPMQDCMKTMTTWANQKKLSNLDDTKKDRQQSILSCDNTSNPPGTRYSSFDDNTDNQKYQTTRILINFKTTIKGDSKQLETTPTEKCDNFNNNKTIRKIGINTHGSWSSGTKKDFDRYINELRSTSLIKDSFQGPSEHSESGMREDIPKLSKPVHEIIHQFDSLSLPKRNFKEKRRKPIPDVYRTPKEYTHSDLEEELKNFTENLDKDFRDIYEEEIGMIRKSKSLRESNFRTKISPKTANLARSALGKRLDASYLPAKSSSDEGSKRSSLRTSSRENYDTDDSDLLADEEVRSYMSTGQRGTDSETEEPCGSSGSRRSFEESVVRFKKPQSLDNEDKEIKNNVEPIRLATTTYLKSKVNGLTKKSPQLAPKYKNNYTCANPIYQNLKPKSCYVSNTSSNELSTDTWDKTSNSSSTMGGKARERVSYLHDLSLSEKYTKYLQRNSNSSIDTISDCNNDRVARVADAPYNKPEAYSAKRYGESKNDRIHKNKVSQRSSPNMKVKLDGFSKAGKEEKILKETAKQMRYFNKDERAEFPKHSYKPKEDKKSHNEHSDKTPSRRERSRSKEKRVPDEVMLEELKKAADEIMVAVNGYTDDSSHVGSSEEEKPRRIIKKEKIGVLGTISEGKRITKTEMRKAISANTRSCAIGNQSSASSLESLSKEPIRKSREVKSSIKHKHGESGKTTSSRTTRLFQRACRTAAIAQPSSSEDIPSYLEQAKRRVFKKQKSATSVKEENDPRRSSSKHRHGIKVESSATLGIKTRKIDKLKESSSVTRSSRSRHKLEDEKTKSSNRKSVAEKSEVEATKKRSQCISSKEGHACMQTRRKKMSTTKKSEGYATLQSA